METKALLSPATSRFLTDASVWINHALQKNRTLTAKGCTIFLCLSLVNLGMPMGVATFAPDPSRPKPAQPKTIERPKSKILTSKEMHSLQGRWSKNPYVAGSNKWSVNYKGVDLMTGNFSLSGTDMTFEGGYGIPVNVTRSYSSNSDDQGPVGTGWTLSVDIRSTAGGLLKSSGAPVRSVPVSFKERHSAQTIDPNAVMSNGSATQPAEAVMATDAGGKEETEQRDVDGVITTPPWDKNTNDPEYEWVTHGGNTYQILVRNTVITPDGTRYLYEKQGSYTGGVNSITGTGSSEPSNVLKISTVTDRHGNVTEYHYKAGTGTVNQVSFDKPNGTTLEQKLDYIVMPNGHQINFTWGSGSTGTTSPNNRIVVVDDNIGSGGRTVTYTYNSNGDLASVTTPAGMQTAYGYDESGYVNSGETSTHSVSGVGSVLTSLTDPRGLITKISYTMEDVKLLPYSVYMKTVKAYKVEQPNGITTHYANTGEFSNLPSDSYFNSLPGALVTTAVYADIAAGESTPFQSGSLQASTLSTSPATFEVGMGGIGGFSSQPVPVGAETWRKQYDCRTQDLLWEARYEAPIQDALSASRGMTSTVGLHKVEVTGEYNFMGNPLWKTVTEASTPSYSSFSYSNTRIATTEYSYWGEDKYFQQRATRMRTGSSSYRYSMTDYFDSTAATGKKGQTRYVYSPAFTSFTTSQGSQPAAPDGTASGDLWKYYVQPSNSADYAATFDYDSKGRPTDVWKLQSTSTSPWTYVQTKTVYGADNSPHWGQAYQVTEDYGSGKINRVTQTNGYTSWGTANDVTDAAGHQFFTDFDSDGKVNSITRIDGSYNDPVVTYTYGTSGLIKGMVTNVTDGLSGVSQDFTYQSSSGGGKGQVASVTETNGSDSYSTAYTYNGAGDRATAVYTTANGTVRWGYKDYIALGDPAAPSHAFRTLVKLDSSMNATDEEFHYLYSGAGKLQVASFAQSPTASSLRSNGSFYDASYPAATRARAYYVYDAGGRQLQVNHWWDTWNSGTNSFETPEAVLANHNSYEVTTGTSNMNRGLKTSSTFYEQHSSTPTSFNSGRTEYYDYDSNRDYLTGADYNDALANETPTWSYDAAGNRNDATVVDNLNRATTIGGVSRTYDILGNTLTKGMATMSWDILNRMAGYQANSSAIAYSYQYRADGMRTRKNFLTSFYSSFAYDGQMPIEEFNYQGSGVARDFIKLIQYGLGARGIDRIERTPYNGSPLVGYPVYDGHGNMVACLFKGSGGTYNLGNKRSYDAWGVIRSGTTTGDPKGRYVANLGHVDDDESGLTYMRARYYEPLSGRFLSEDPGFDGMNWYAYSKNDPISHADANGKVAIPIGWLVAMIFAGAAGEAAGLAAGKFSFRWSYARMIQEGQRGATQDRLELIIRIHDNVFVDILKNGVTGVLAYFLVSSLPTKNPGVVAVGLVFAISFGMGFIMGFYTEMITAFLAEI